MVEFSIPNSVLKVGLEVEIKSIHEVDNLVPVLWADEFTSWW